MEVTHNEGGNVRIMAAQESDISGLRFQNYGRVAYDYLFCLFPSVIINSQIKLPLKTCRCYLQVCLWVAWILEKEDNLL